MNQETLRQPSVGIIGAGMSGLCQAMVLRRAGILDVTIYEKARDVGGTWRDNTYPGLACDVPSRFYQFTFAPNPAWTRFFSPGPEIGSYFRWVATEFGLNEAIRFGTEVEAGFDGGRWTITTDTGETAKHDFLISATGVLRIPRVPAIPGLDDFDGPVMHSARWDHSVDLTGKRVAVIGTGSTGVQIVCGLADSVARLELFQRSAQWILPLPNPRYRRLSARAHERVPIVGRAAYLAYREAFEFFAHALVEPGWRRRGIGLLCRANLLTVRDRELRRRLTPDYQPMCRRLVISAGFCAAMQRPNVDLVDAGIDHVAARRIVTADGAVHDVDAIVLATGFDAHAFMRPMTVVGGDGRSVEELWEHGPKALLGVSLPGFENFFTLIGPHSPVGNYSLTAIAESQTAHVLSWIKRWQRAEFDSVAPTDRATDEFNAAMRAALPGTVWATGCTSWYLGADGLPELWPWTPRRYRERLAASPELGDYELVGAGASSGGSCVPVDDQLKLRGDLVDTRPVAKHLVDLDEHALDVARAEFGTTTINDTVNEALSAASLDDREDTWR